MRIGILGAGISGLSIAKLLTSNYDVEVLEQCSAVGGIAKIKNIDGIAYHPVGGHCFNSKHQEVLDFVFNNVLAKEHWNLVKRKAVIQFQDYVIPYPIEYSVKAIFKFDKKLAINIVEDFLGNREHLNATNLEEWFRNQFGNTLAEKYFIPYNQKIWNIHPKEMNYSWVKDKLPMPDRASFIKNFFEDQSDDMSHNSFFYPNKNHEATFIHALANGSNVTLNYKVKSLEHNTLTKKWIVNSEKQYDLIINTLPLNIIPGLVQDCPSKVLASANKLRYNKVTTMFWKSEPNENTWTYIPAENSIFHRYIHIGNFNNPSKNYTITEAIGERSYAEMERCGRKDPTLIEPLDYNVSDHAYVVFDANYEQCKFEVKNYLDDIGILTLGRFGEWEYYNMDICIKSSLDMYKKLRKKFYLHGH